MAFEILGIGLKYCQKQQIQEEAMMADQVNENPQEEPGEDRLVVCIDAGHGGKDAGSPIKRKQIFYLAAPE